MMTLQLTPERERRLTAYAQHKQQPVERVIEEWVDALPDVTPEPAPKESQTWGAKKWAELEAVDALGVFQDRPEDSMTLARKFQALAEGHDGEGHLAT